MTKDFAIQVVGPLVLILVPILLGVASAIRDYRRQRTRERLREMELQAIRSRRPQAPPARNPGPTVHAGKVDRTLQPGNSSVPGSSRASEPVLFDPLNPLNPLSPISPFNQVSDPTPSRCEPSSGGWESIGGGGSGSDWGSSACDSSSSTTFD